MIYSSGERHSAGALGCFVTSLQGIAVWKSFFFLFKILVCFSLHISLLVKFLKSCNTFPFSTQLTVNTLSSEGVWAAAECGLGGEQTILSPAGQGSSYPVMQFCISTHYNSLMSRWSLTTAWQPSAGSRKISQAMSSGPRIQALL